jgi:hypothetical protein
MREKAFPCPCCGHVVFSEPPGSHEICPICFWEDDLSQLRFPLTTGANQVSLVDGQKNYRELGACEERLRQEIRKPDDNEPVESGWRPIDLASDSAEIPAPQKDYSATFPTDCTQLYYWRETYWKRKE